MSDVEVWLISGLQSKKIISEDGLPEFRDIQPEIRSIVEWDAYHIAMNSASKGKNHNRTRPAEVPLDVHEGRDVGHQEQCVSSKHDRRCFGLSKVSQRARHETTQRQQIQDWRCWLDSFREFCHWVNWAPIMLYLACSPRRECSPVRPGLGGLPSS